MKKVISDGLYAAFDVGTSSIKAVIVELIKGEKRLVTIEKEELKPITEFPGDDEYRHYLIETLKSLASRLPMKELRGVSSVFSHRELQTKIIELPSQVLIEQIEKILSWEAKKLLSPNYKEEPFTFSYKIVNNSPLKVAITVIPQHIFEKFAELFSLAGIELTGSFSEVFCGQSLKDIIDQTNLPALSIVNLGQSGTHLQIFSAGELRFYRFIPSGTSEFSEPPVTSELEMYAQKIRFSFDYFRAVTKLSQIDALFFMGGGASIQDFLPFVRSYFSPTRINIVDISAGVDISPILPEIGENAPAEDKQRRLLAFLPAVGAVMSEIDQNADAMNMARQLREKKREKQLQKLSTQIPIYIGIVGILLTLASLISIKNHKLSELQRLQDEVTTVSTLYEASQIKLKKLKKSSDKSLKLLPQEKKAIAPILKSDLSASEILFYIAKSKPDEVSISDILLRSSQEAEEIQIEKEPELNDQLGDSTNQDSNESPFLSKLGGMNSSGDDQLEDSLKAQILIVSGKTDSSEALASFTHELTKKRLVARYKTIVTRKNKDGKIQFLLKGELP